jgi:L-lactate dehydrogenase (cytochrome)
MQFAARFNWKDAELLLGKRNGPAAIMGVVRSDGAREAVYLCFDAGLVSNHGGRQLDRSPTPVDVLEPIADAVGAVLTS